MSKEFEKMRVGIYIDKDILTRCDSMLQDANVKSRNEFITEALKFYCGYLNSGKAENYLLQTLSSVLTSNIRDTENRLSRMDFKIAVELAKLAHVVAFSTGIDNQELGELHYKCLDEVKRINGTITFEEAYLYQRREDMND